MRHVFLSYSHKDNDFAQLLRIELQNSGIPSWLATDDIKPGEDWKTEIDDAINNSFALIVIISPESDRSKYVTYEWALAYGLGVPIIPILYKHLEFPQKLHPRLESLQYEDFTINTNRPWHRIVERLSEIQAEYIRKEKLDPKIEEAIQALDDWDPARIVRAAGMLGRRKVQSAVPKLDRLLDEPDTEIQLSAIKALGEIGSSQAVNKIINLVDVTELKLSAIEALGKIADPRAADVLLQQIQTDNCEQKITAIKALGNFPSQNIRAALFGLMQNSKYRCEERWDEDDTNSVQVLASIYDVLLKGISQEDLFVLLSLLESEDSNVLAKVIQLLDVLHDEMCLPQLLKLTRHESNTVKKSAGSVLKKFKSVENYQQIAVDLAGKDNKKYGEAIDFFYKHFGMQGLLYILALDESNAHWEVSNKIEDVLKDSDTSLIHEALKDSNLRVRGFLADVIRRKNLSGFCNELRILAEDESAFVRGLAIRAIGDLKCSKSINILKKRLQDTNNIFSNSTNEVRDFAAIALAKLNQKVALPRLKELMFGSKTDLRVEASELFVSLGGDVDKEQFVNALQGNDPVLRATALTILVYKEMGIRVTDLKKALASKQTEVRLDAINRLGEIYTPLGLVIALTFDHVISYWEIAEELTKKINSEYSGLITKLLSDKHYRVRAFLAEMIGLRPDLKLGEDLLPLADDDVEFVRGLTIRALGRLKLLSG
jgi:HEAT repeat protein